MSDINLGPYRLNPRGELDPTKKYKFLDLVTYQGSSYVNINNDIIDGDASIGVLPTAEEGATKYYQLIAARGPEGKIAEQYDQFTTITSNDWDYSVSDKIKISGAYDNSIPINILNVYDGCCGIIVTDLDIVLPVNSDVSIDFQYLSLSLNEYFVYSFIYDGDRQRFIWNRTIYKANAI